MLGRGVWASSESTYCGGEDVGDASPVCCQGSAQARYHDV